MKSLSVFVLLMGLVAFGSCIGTTYGYFKPVADGIPNPDWVFIVIQLWIFSTVAADITITACMMVIFYQAKSMAHFRETRNRISKISRVALQTGLLTTVLALLVPILGRAVGFGLYVLPWYFLGKSYTISLLANLNARPRKNDITTHTNGTIGANGRSHVTTIAFAPRQRSQEDNPTSSHGISRFLRSLRMVNRAPGGSSQAADLEAPLSSDVAFASAAGTSNSEFPNPNEK